MPNDCLTLAEAAEFLNVSRPYILRLVEGGKVSLARSDLVQYKDEHMKAALEALQLLADQAQELDMGY